MSVHTYIGARYVPRFMGVYDATQIYEALDVVDNGLGTSYISKKQTPAGTPLTDTTYWAIYGASSGAIINLQNQIDDMNDGTVPGSLQNQINDNTTDITDLKQYSSSIWHNKKVVVYGDSLSTVAYNYWQYMVAADPTIQLTNRAVGGSRIQDGYTLLQAATDLNTFDIIVLAYGTNSWANTSLKEMVNKYIECFAEISGDAPKAQIVCIAPYFSYNPNYGISSVNDLGYGIFDYSAAITNICNMYGGVAFNLYDLAGVNQWNYTQWLEMSTGGLYLHENEALGRKIAHILLTHDPSTTPTYGYYFLPVTGTTNGLIFVRQGVMLNIFQRGSILITDLEALDLTHLAPVYTMTGWVRGQQTGTMGLVAINGSTGVVSISWNSPTPPTDTHVQGLHIQGLLGLWRPH